MSKEAKAPGASQETPIPTVIAGGLYALRLLSPSLVQFNVVGKAIELKDGVVRLQIITFGVGGISLDGKGTRFFVEVEIGHFGGWTAI